jgi:hypothetical protein
LHGLELTKTPFNEKLIICVYYERNQGSSVKKSVQKIKAWSRPKKAALGVAAFIVIVAVAASGNHNQTNLNATSVRNKSASQTQAKPTVVTKIETEVQAIPYGSTTVNNSSMTKGTSKVTSAGINGSQTLTYKVTYTNGKQANRQLVNTTITTQPVTQVTSIGTYVAPPPPPAPTCSNGSYVNSAGNTVCNPSSSSSGATAKCGDGTYSYSQSRSGTCSHHGGVAEWL